MRITHAKQLLVACLLAALPGMVFAQDNEKPAKAPNPSEWNQWRGAERTGFDTSKKWPKKIDSNNFKRVWRMEMGPSYSGPVIQGDIVFTMDADLQGRSDLCNGCYLFFFFPEHDLSDSAAPTSRSLEMFSFLFHCLHTVQLMSRN